MQIDFTIDTIKEAAQVLWNNFSGKKIWAFDAEMGAGKTTFLKALCEKVLLCEDVISSPTFSIINEYKSPVAGKILHMDWYRLKDEEEAMDAGVEDALFSGNYCFVEWPECAPLLLPDDTLYLKIAIKENDSRTILIEENTKL